MFDDYFDPPAGFCEICGREMSGPGVCGPCADERRKEEQADGNDDLNDDADFYNPAF